MLILTSQKNWIRSGDYTPLTTENNSTLGWKNPFLYPDEKGLDPDKKYTKILNGGVAPHCLVGYQSDYILLLILLSLINHNFLKQDSILVFLDCLV